MKTHASRRCLPALALMAVLGATLGGATASAQEPDDFSFAKRLAYRGWFDLAAHVCARIEKDLSLPRDVRAALPILLAEIELAKADRENDSDKAMKHISESIARLQKFIAEEVNHPKIFEAQINIGYLKSRKAKSLVDQIEGAKNARDHDRLRKEADALYKEVAAEFEESVQNWKRLPDSVETAGAIMDARLEAERARYENARVPGLAEVDRKKLLEDAVKSLVDFEIDYGDTAKAFEAMLLDSRCLFELGEYAQAETKLKSTVALKDILIKAKIPGNPYFDQIIFGAYLTLSQVYLKSNRSKDAEKYIDGLFKSDPNVEREWIGSALKVEKVEALFRQKKNVEAQVLAEKVITADPNGPWAALMRKKLQGMGSAGIVRLDPKRAIQAAEGSMERGRFREALGTLRQAIEGCVTEASKAENVPNALYLMGQCLSEMKRNYEAAINFEKVYSVAPGNKELSPQALWQAVICFSEEFDTFGDPADERDKNRVMDVLVKAFPGHPVTDNIYYLQGRTLEAQRKLVEAADRYLKVPERASAHERALVRAAYCLRADAFRQYSQLKKKDAAAEQAILDQLTKAEALFKKFLKRVADIPAENPEMARDRASLVIVVNQELAFLYNHKLVGKAEESLAFLNKVAKDMAPDDERMARIHLLQIQSFLVLNKNDEAVQTMELMYDRFPHVQETAQACKSVAIRLDEITSAIIKANEAKGIKELDEVSKDNLKKVSRYYKKWMDGAMAFGMDARVTDVMAVADTLYAIAKRLNGVSDTTSFMDLKRGQIVGWKNYFEDAEFVHGLLVSDKFRGKYPEKDRLILMAQRARCLSFIAEGLQGWTSAKVAYEDIVKDYKIVTEKGDFVPSALVENPILVGTYLELGAVYHELGRFNKIHYDNAITTFTNVTSVCASGGEPWWLSRYGCLEAYFYRGKERDIMTAQIGIKMLQDNYPNFDGGKYGLQEKFNELKRKIDMTGGVK
jgi:tetratricopeptide (TPR) repeat protein